MVRNKGARLGATNSLERSLLVLLFFFLVAGVLAVGSASAPQAAASGGSSWSYLERDLIYVLIGVAAFLVMTRVTSVVLANFAPVLMALSLGLLGVVEVLGSSASGGQRWLGFGGLQFQPSELFKLATCIYLAYGVARIERSGRNWQAILKTAWPPLVGAGIIFAEPDMGTASIVVLVTFAVLIVAGLPGRTIRLFALAGLSLAGIFAFVAPYRRERLLSFLHPTSDPTGAGYQVLQAKIGLGAGRIAGLGYGQGREKWGLLPNPHTDFIFAVIGEELGFIGAVFVIGLFTWLLIVASKVALRAPDRESQLLSAGITFWLGFEAIINIASVVGLWPVTGIPLPFFSYGGTSLVIDLMALGLLVNVARRIKPTSAFETPVPSVRTHQRRPVRRREHAIPRREMRRPVRETASRR
jgi:cell division protein FtsW